jgi:hypothetical protein
VNESPARRDCHLTQNVDLAIRERFVADMLGEVRSNIRRDPLFIRLLSFILPCTGVQIVWNGLSKLLSTIS